MMRGDLRDQDAPRPRWETIQGGSERIGADELKITVEGRTAAPRSQRVGFTLVVDDRIPGDYQRKMRRAVRFLDERDVV